MLVFPKCNHPLITKKSPPTPLNYLRHVTSASPLAASPPRLRAKAMPCGASKRSHKSWIPWTSSGAWSWHAKITDSQLGPQCENLTMGIFGWYLDGIVFLVFWWAIFGSLILKKTQEVFDVAFFLGGSQQKNGRMTGDAWSNQPTKKNLCNKVRKRHPDICLKPFCDG